MVRPTIVAVSPVFLASLVTVLPGMATLWYYLRRYEGYFQEPKLFFALISGLFAGLVIAAFEFFTNFGADDFIAAAGIGSAFMFFVIGYAFFESGVKTMVLGLGRFRSHKDTPYYGVALGIGIGAMVAMMVIANALRIGDATGNPYGWGTGIAMALIPMGAMFAHGATGAWVGYGSAQGKLWKGWGIGTLLQMPVLGIFWLWWPSIGAGNVTVLVPTLLSPVYGLGLLWLTQVKVLDKVVPKEIQDKIRRDKRRQARGVGQAVPLAALDREEE